MASLAVTVPSKSQTLRNSDDIDSIFLSLSCSSYGICFQCSKIDKKMKCCSGCRAAWYCDATCQKLEYPKHRNECRSLRKLRKKMRKDNNDNNNLHIDEMTEEKCQTLIKYVIDEITKLQGIPSFVGLSETELTENLQKLQEVRALFFEIVTWDQHIKCINNSDEVHQCLFVTCYRYCLSKHAEVYQILFSLEKHLACIEIVNRNYFRGAMYEKFWLEKGGLREMSSKTTLDDPSMFNADKETFLGEIALLQEGGEDAAYYHYLAATKINDKIRKLNEENSVSYKENKIDYYKLLSTIKKRPDINNMNDSLNNGHLFRKMMHCKFKFTFL